MLEGRPKKKKRYVIGHYAPYCFVLTNSRAYTVFYVCICFVIWGLDLGVFGCFVIAEFFVIWRLDLGVALS